MSFREGETKHFPFDRTDVMVWYAIIVHDVRFTRYSYTSSKSGKKDFINNINYLKSEGQSYLLLGIWQGQWRTDIFILDEKTVLKKLGGIT